MYNWSLIKASICGETYSSTILSRILFGNFLSSPIIAQALIPPPVYQVVLILVRVIPELCLSWVCNITRGRHFIFGLTSSDLCIISTHSWLQHHARHRLISIRPHVLHIMVEISVQERRRGWWRWQFHLFLQIIVLERRIAWAQRAKSRPLIRHY